MGYDGEKEKRRDSKSESLSHLLSFKCHRKSVFSVLYLVLYSSHFRCRQRSDSFPINKHVVGVSEEKEEERFSISSAEYLLLLLVSWRSWQVTKHQIWSLFGCLKRASCPLLTLLFLGGVGVDLASYFQHQQFLLWHEGLKHAFSSWLICLSGKSKSSFLLLKRVSKQLPFRISYNTKTVLFLYFVSYTRIVSFSHF